MFNKANVDGQSSVMPGVDDAKAEQTQTQEDVHDSYEEENDTTAPSPVQPSPAQPKRSVQQMQFLVVHLSSRKIMCQKT